MKNNQNKSKVEEPCIHFGGEDYCPEFRHDKITCDYCAKFIAAHKGTAVTVVESKPLNRLTAEPLNYKSRVSDQYAAIETAKDNLLRECVKFGALLTEVGYYLGEARGRGKDGEGLQAWLAENCPEVNYSTAMNYKALAGKCVKMLGGGSQAVAVLQDKTVVQEPGTGETIDVESKFIEKRDELFNEVKSRRELEQTYFKFMASEGRRGPGRPKGTKADLSRKPDSTDVEASARAVWSQVIVPADRSAVALKSAAKLLTLEDVENAKTVLASLMEMLKEREEELKD